MMRFDVKGLHVAWLAIAVMIAASWAIALVVMWIGA